MRNAFLRSSVTAVSPGRDGPDMARNHFPRQRIGLGRQLLLLAFELAVLTVTTTVGLNALATYLQSLARP